MPTSKASKQLQKSAGHMLAAANAIVENKEASKQLQKSAGYMLASANANIKNKSIKETPAPPPKAKPKLVFRDGFLILE
tara:strand:+ start:195 stop:431 length:237 start_codon:yes stop_codon:yes gene_type:complete